MCCPGPCKTLYVGVDLECGTSTANLYWEEQEGVELYVATATYGMGTTQCNSTNSTCKFHSLKCGETYQFSVTAHSQGCHSDVSSTVEIQTGRMHYHQLINWLDPFLAIRNIYTDYFHVLKLLWT